MRIVGECCADADDNRVYRRTPSVCEQAAFLAADPLGVPGTGGDLAVEGHCRLEQHPWATYPRMLAKRLVEQPCARGELTVCDEHLDAFVAEDPQAATRCLLRRIVGGDHDPCDAGSHDRVCARWRVAFVTARLQRHVQGGLIEVHGAARFDRVDLGVRPAVALVPAFAEDLTVARHDGAHKRVGLHLAGSMLGELDGSCEMSPSVSVVIVMRSSRIGADPARTVRAASAVQPVDGHLRSRSPV